MKPEARRCGCFVAAPLASAAASPGSPAVAVYAYDVRTASECCLDLLT